MQGTGEQIAPRFRFSNVAEFVRIWCDVRSNPPNAARIRYEKCLRDRPGPAAEMLAATAEAR
jgi:hypothetical protein